MMERREYIPKMPGNWWWKRKTYFLFMVRELTCVFVGGYALFLLLLVAHLDDSASFGAILDSPVLVILQWIALPFVLYHSITWINLTPKVVVLRRGEERVSPILIAGTNYIIWAVLSSVILWIVFLDR